MPLLDRQLRVWFGGNIGGPIILYFCNTDLTSHVTGSVARCCCSAESTFAPALSLPVCLRVAGAFQFSHFVNFDHIYTTLLLFSLTLCAWLYYSIYSSAPGSPTDISSSLPQSPPCEHCGITSPTIRVRHDFATGAETLYKRHSIIYAVFTAWLDAEHLSHSAFLMLALMHCILFFLGCAQADAW